MRNFLYKRKIIYIILIIIGIVTVTGTTYAIFTTTTAQEGTNTIETLKCLELEFSNQKNIISLLNTYPMTDERGSKNTPYTFTLTNKCGTYVEYSVGLAINKDNTLEDKYVKTVFSLANDTGEPVLLTDRVAGELYNNKKTYIFRNDGLENNASKDYKLVLWVDGTASDSEMQKSFSANIIINTKPIKNVGQKTITVDLDGGNLLQELNEIYREGMKIKLPIPAKAGYHFTKWEVTSGDATLDENNYLTIGKENISLKAYYQGRLTLTLELNGGNTTQTINDFYGSGEKVTLIEPTKEGYKFNGWKITSGDGTLDGNTLTINTESVVIEATWKKQVTLTLDLNGGSTNQTFNDFYNSGENITLIEPTKEGYKFNGWKITSDDGTLDGNILTINTKSVVIEATWLKILTLNIKNAKGGSIVINNITTNQAVTVNSNSSETITALQNDQISVSASPITNFSLVSISSNEEALNNNTTISLLNDTTIKTSYRRNDYFLFNLDSVGNVSFSKSSCDGACNAGTDYESYQDATRHHYVFVTKRTAHRLDAVSDIKVDLTDFSHVCSWQYNATNTNYITENQGAFYLGILTDRSQWVHSNAVASFNNFPMVTSKELLICGDISSYQGSYYVGMQLLYWPTSAVSITTFVHYINLIGTTYTA